MNTFILERGFKMDKEGIINYVRGELDNINIRFVPDCVKFNDIMFFSRGTFFYNKYDRSRAVVVISKYGFTQEEYISVALHELGHAKMFVKYSIREYRSYDEKWHELGAWNIALSEAQKLGIKLEMNYIQKCLLSYEVGIRDIEGLMNKWKTCLYSQSSVLC